MGRYPFITILAKAVTKLIPGDDSLKEGNSRHLAAISMEQSPSIALGQAKEEIIKMGYLSVKGLNELLQYLLTNSNKHRETALQFKGAINSLDEKVSDYLVRISTIDFSKKEAAKYVMLIDTVREIEKIGDRFENIIDLVEHPFSHKAVPTDPWLSDLKEVFQMTIDTVDQAIIAFDHYDLEQAKEIVENKDILGKTERMLRRERVFRMNGGQGEINLVDLVTNLEKIEAHAVKLSKTIIGDCR
ncbi:Na/Pi cotransporter family protein [Peribacillus cavernae]|uniref:Na/Pi cotransporter family protein n=1 Tax=Peribacillus cavernae TaxID=1674310 RepID=A0A3S0TUT6_9BACI|nr:PhoU domain-containing protein [Peribacillus cavernae]MDQ0218296.1 Na+/phosphate symporter [Peribacillus cavernae]RUQ28422.1 Na/Pi cotransporter family protein [Peribacillus cavernae]